MILSIKNLALSLGVAFMPLGCGGSEISYSPIHPTHESQEIPESVVARLTECAKQAPAWLKSAANAEPAMYAIQFNVHVTRGGGVSSVDVRDSTLGGGDIEACLASALQGMSLPMRGMATQLAPQSRALVGTPALVGLAPVSLAPVLITGIGIIVVVAIVLYVSTDKGDDEAQRCKGVKEICIKKCSEETFPTKDFGMAFFNCKNECMEAHGCPRDS